MCVDKVGKMIIKFKQAFAQGISIINSNLYFTGEGKFLSVISNTQLDLFSLNKGTVSKLIF